MKQTNMIEKVKELRKLEEKGNALIATTSGHLELSELLDALGKIREGDANEIDYAIQELSHVLGQENIAETIEVLHRYRDMARMMEDEEEVRI